jgi:low affinity Fe/Cu permease
MPIEAPYGSGNSRGGSAVNDVFRKFAHWTSCVVGSPWAFIGAVLAIVTWAVTGPLFGFSDTWQLVINTATTIVTFWMVFLIQNTQNRDARAIHLKLDELLRAQSRAHTSLATLEELSDEQLDRLQERFHLLAEREARREQRNGEAIVEVAQRS